MLFLLAIPIIAGINYYLTYSGIRLNWFLALTFAIDTVQGYMAWWIVRWLIKWLDKVKPYQQGVGKRIVTQVLVTLVAGLSLLAITTELVSWIARGKPANLSFYTVDLVIIAIWFFVINGVYIFLHYYHEWKSLAQQRQQAATLLEAGLFVQKGRADLKLPYSEIAGCYVEGDYVMVTNKEGNRYFVDQPLDKLDAVLPPDLFFRMNRQYIVHIQMVTGFRRSENGKIVVLLLQHSMLPQEITVSRVKAPAFKVWFRPQV